MISKQEVADFAREFGLSVQVIEKDYVLGWLLAGITAHPALANSWVFKGGTCLKKCYFETYRFSEDLDFTLRIPEQVEQDFLLNTFNEIAEWVNDSAGIEIPPDTIVFDIYDNPRGKRSVMGKVGYYGPLQRRGDAPRIKLDLTDDEKLVLAPVQRAVHHPYSDKPEAGIQVLAYDFEEVFAEKIRALAERERPRDLYDVVHLYRRDDFEPNRALIRTTLESKCQFKNIPVPTFEDFQNSAGRQELETDWESMLAHQLQKLPPFQHFWRELKDVFDWLFEVKEKPRLAVAPVSGGVMDKRWTPPAMMHAWRTGVPLEAIRFAGANRLCVNLRYQNSVRLIEPYSLSRTQEGNILLHTVRHNDGESRSYRLDRIQGVEISNISFVPRYAIALTSSGGTMIVT